MRWEDVLLLLSGFLVVGLFSCGVLYLVAILGGWRELASIYPAPKGVQGKSVWMGTITLGKYCNYSNCVVLRSNADGLLLKLWPPFQVGHPPLFLPWREMRASLESRWWVKVLCIRMDRSPVEVRIPASDVSTLRQGLELSPISDVASPDAV